MNRGSLHLADLERESKEKNQDCEDRPGEDAFIHIWLGEFVLKLTWNSLAVSGPAVRCTRDRSATQVKKPQNSSSSVDLTERRLTRQFIHIHH